MPGALLDLLAHVVIDLHVKDIRHQVQRILVVLDLCIEARKVESIGQVILVDFAKILVAAGRDELFVPMALVSQQPRKEKRKTQKEEKRGR